MEIAERLIKQYNWKGEIIGVVGEGTFFPKNGAHWDCVKEKIRNGKSIVVEPSIDCVLERKNSKGKLIGYRWGSLFVPNYLQNNLFQLIEKTIFEGKCKVEHVESKRVFDDDEVNSIIFGFFLESEWRGLEHEEEFNFEYSVSNNLAPVSVISRIQNVSRQEEMGLLSRFFFDKGIESENYLDLSGFEQAFFSGHYKFGYLEVEIGTNKLSKLFRNIKSNAPSIYGEYLEELYQQEMKEYERTNKQGPRTEWLIRNVQLYLPRIIADMGNKVIQAYISSFSDLPQQYINYDKQRREEIIYYRLNNGALKVASLSASPSFSSVKLNRADIERSIKEGPLSLFKLVREIKVRLLQGKVMDALVSLNSFLEIRLKTKFIRAIPAKYDQLIKKPLSFFVGELKKEIAKILSENKNSDPRVILEEGVNLHELERYGEFLSVISSLNKFRDEYIHLLAFPEGMVFEGEIKFRVEDEISDVCNELFFNLLDHTEDVLINLWVDLKSGQNSFNGNSHI
ncbi:MAG: hypothetical protein EOM42_07455 [Negativicutes bacterium]|nr:hypothetical protein [Negativicutes bacterium]